MITNWKLMIKGLFIFLCFLSLDIYVPCSLMAGVGDNMSLSADPTSIQADGLSTTKIKAVVDKNGILLTGVKLTFTTTNGAFQDPTTGGGTKKLIDTYSDTSGASTVVLYSAQTPGTATITCVASGPGTYTVPNPAPPPATITISVPFEVTRSVDVYFTGPDPTNSIVLSADKTSVPANNIDSAKITATLYDQYGTPIKKPGILVVFTTTPTGLAHFANGPTSTTIPVSTDATGTAAALLYSAVAGSAGVSASVNGIPSQSIFVIFTQPTPTPTPIPTPTPAPYLASFLLSSDTPSVSVVGIKPATISAQLYDQYGKAFASPGVSVDFTTTPIGLAHFSNNLPTIKISTDSSGKATALLYSSIAGTATVSARIDIIPLFTPNPVFVNFTGPSSTADIVLSLDCPGSCDGKSFFTITATLYDRYGQFVSSGEAVNFTTTIGYFANKLSSITAYTNSVGVASVVIYSGGVIGTAQVSASSNGITRYMDVKFTGVGQPADIVLSLNCNGSCDNSSFFTITATLYDKNRQLVSSGVEVDFTTTIGYFSNKLKTITAYTNSTGVASVVFNSGDLFGTAQISASSYGIIRYIDVVCSGGWPPADILLFTDCYKSCDGLSFFTITAELHDKNGKTISSGVAVNFATTLGYFANKLNAITAYTYSNGAISVVFYTGGAIGTAQISASAYGITRYLDVLCTGAGTPTYISLSAARSWIPADGYSYTAVTAVILDGGAKPVPAGTAVEFSTTLGTFENGKQKYVVATPDATGIVTVHLIATSTVGPAQITCKWGSGMASAQITVLTVLLEYETEPNNEMVQADGICFRNVFLGQLSSPYEEDWYTFTTTESSRIGINFITTAAPADANCDSGTTTVGTWKVDIRDSDNNVLMSYHNVDCIFDNGTWETGVVPQGTYYVVVYCPRLGGTGDIYLSDPYYLRVLNDFYFPCVDRDQSVNSATLSQKDSAYRLHVPIVDTTSYLWTDFQYDPISATSLMFKLTNYGVLTNLEGYRACNLSTLSMIDGNYVLHIPLLIFDGVSYRADLIYMPTTDGQIWFMLTGFWAN